MNVFERAGYMKQVLALLSVLQENSYKLFTDIHNLGARGKELHRMGDDLEAYRTYFGNRSIHEELLDATDDELEGMVRKLCQTLTGKKKTLPKRVKNVFVYTDEIMRLFYQGKYGEREQSRLEEIKGELQPCIDEVENNKEAYIKGFAYIWNRW